MAGLKAQSLSLPELVVADSLAGGVGLYRGASDLDLEVSSERAREACPVLRRFNWFRDAEVVYSFQEDTFSVNFPDFIMTRRFETAFRNDLRRATNDRNHGVFVVEIEGEVVGFLWVAIFSNTWTGERYGYINNIYVRPELRERGIGNMMMAKAESFFRFHHLRKLRLTVTSSNAAALGLYQKAGFQIQRHEMEKDME